MKKKDISEIAKKASKIKVNKKLDSIEDAPFFKKKMEKAVHVLSVTGLPK